MSEDEVDYGQFRSANVRPAAPVSPDEVGSMLAPPSGMAIVKLESTEMTAMARQKPRDHKMVMKDVVDQLNAYPAFARSAIYNKPVGKVFRVTCKCGTKYEVAPQWGGGSESPRTDPCPKCNRWDPDKLEKIQKYARGLSIKAAEALFSAWGNCAASFVSTADTLEYSEFAAIFIDYEKCTKFTFPVRVSKSYKGKGGKVITHQADRFADVILAAARSKALREVILRSLPPGLREELFEKAETVINGLLDPSTQAKLVSAFENMGITPSQLEEHVGKKLDKFTQSDRADLLGVYNAIKDGETTKEQAFEAAYGQRERTVVEMPLPQGLSPAPSASTVQMKPEAQEAAQAPAPIQEPQEPTEDPDNLFAGGPKRAPIE